MILSAAIFAAAGSVDGASSAQSAGEASIPSAEVREFLGEWILRVEVQGSPIEMSLSVKDSDGAASAWLHSSQNPEPTPITGIERDGDWLALHWQRTFNGHPMTLEMELIRQAPGVRGTLGETRGLFTADVEGSRRDPKLGLREQTASAHPPE